MWMHLCTKSCSLDNTASRLLLFSSSHLYGRCCFFKQIVSFITILRPFIVHLSYWVLKRSPWYLVAMMVRYGVILSISFLNDPTNSVRVRLGQRTKLSSHTVGRRHPVIIAGCEVKVTESPAIWQDGRRLKGVTFGSPVPLVNILIYLQFAPQGNGMESEDINSPFLLRNLYCWGRNTPSLPLITILSYLFTLAPLSATNSRFNPITAGVAYIRVFIFYHHIMGHLLNMAKIKCDIKQQELKKVDFHFVKSE